MKKTFTIVALTPILMSIAKAPIENTYKFQSDVMGSTTSIYRLIANDSIKKICPSNVLGNEAASVIFNYEIFEKKRDFAPYNGYKTSFHVIYRADIFLSNNVYYKGGVGNWFDGNNPSYIDSFKVYTTFKGGTIKKTDDTIFTPNVKNGSFSMIDDLGPSFGLFGSSLYNYIDTSQGFDANLTYNAYSYTMNRSKIIDFDEYSSFNNRLVAKTYKESNIQDGEIKVKQTYDYGYQIYFDNQKNVNVLDDQKKDCVSGPNKGDNNFKFSVFGALNVETEEIDYINIDVQLNTKHGSTVWLDLFDANASISLNVQC